MTDLTGKKIVIFVRGLSGGGAQRVMVRYANALADKGCYVTLLTLNNKGAFRKEVSDKVDIKELKNHRLILAIYEISKVFKSINPDTIFVTEPASNIAITVAKLISGVCSRLVLREGLFPSIAIKMSPYIQTRLAYKLAPFIYPLADVVVAIATELYDDLENFLSVPKKKLALIPINPVVDDVFLRMLNTSEIPPFFNHKTGEVIIGVGRLEKQKDFITLIRAFELVRASRVCSLILVGDGSLKAELEEFVSKSSFSSDVIFTGFVDNPYPYIKNSDVLVMSSCYEGLPNTLIESLACGTQVVSTDCQSGPRDILGSGKYGALVPVGDYDAMAASIIEKLDFPMDRNVLIQRGMKYTLENSINNYIPVLFPDEKY